MFDVSVSPVVADNVDELVPIHLEAFAGFKNARLGERYARAFLEWFCTSRDAVALAAGNGGRLIGYVVGAPAGYQRQLNRRLAPVVARCLVSRPALLFDPQIASALRDRFDALVRGGAHGEGGRTLPAPTYSLVGLGVAASARGAGSGGALVRTFEDEVRRRGGRSMRLTVLQHNRSACRLYERCGWIPSGEEGEVVRYTKVLS